ncbi:MAG: hypothetical protein GF365_01055 [Candidatus Buchananbacteria bacterium]|nr:hypothetical protein [Candidatus Buchananbacteria bacterium]
MKIICIDDKQDELDKAKDAVEKAGHDFIGILAGQKDLIEWIFQIENSNVDAVITDMFFNAVDARHRHAFNYDNPPPAGLIVVLHSIAHNKPVVVCSSMDCDYKENYHHGAKHGWIWDGYLNTAMDEEHNPVFRLVRQKDWELAVNCIIEEIIKK